MVFATPSKAQYGSPLGVDALAEVVAALSAPVAARTVPVFALGGIAADTAAKCRAVGARVACIRAVLGAQEPGSAAHSLL